MAGWYGTGVYIRNLSVPSPHSASTLGGGHTFRHMGKETLQRDQRKEQTVEKTCRLNSKRTQLSKIRVVFN
jgi:hypothetical protein